MRKMVPALIGCACGLLVVAEFFSPRFGLPAINQELRTIIQILAAFAYILGGINLIQVNYPKMRRREADWQYKLVMLVGAVVMLMVGLKWQNVGDDPTPGIVTVGGYGSASPERPSIPVPDGKAVIRINTENPHAVVRIDGGVAVAATVDGRPLEVAVDPGKHMIQVSMPLPVTGYLPLEKEFEVSPGQVADARADLPMLYGPEGRVYTWLYNYVFAPCNSTMFALLAFYIASAAFRAFRARNTEAALLLGAAIIVLLGRAPIGAYLSEIFPDVTNWIIDIPNNAGRRAIVMGAALGAIGTGLRIVLGVERSHLGAD